MFRVNQPSNQPFRTGFIKMYSCISLTRFSDVLNAPGQASSPTLKLSQLDGIFIAQLLRSNMKLINGYFVQWRTERAWSCFAITEFDEDSSRGGGVCFAKEIFLQSKSFTFSFNMFQNNLLNLIKYHSNCVYLCYLHSILGRAVSIFMAHSSELKRNLK